MNEVGHRPEDRSGEFISVGVIDSVLDFPPAWDITLDEQRNFVASTDNDTTGHGTEIVDILTYVAPDATFSMYRTVAEDGKFRPSNYLKALDAARSNYVDIINSSAGIHHQDCKGRCRICEAVRDLASDGICVIAGAGNTIESDTDVYCPARIPETVSVGVYEAICTCEVGHPSQSPVGPNPTIYPPGCYCVPSGAQQNGDWRPDKPYCGGIKCTAHDTCSNHRVEQLWSGNPTQTSGTIDVFAPGTSLRMGGSGPILDIGTSFSTAIVAGALADIFGTIHNSRSIPTPSEVSNAVDKLGTTVGGTRSPKFNSSRILDYLS